MPPSKRDRRERARRRAAARGAERAATRGSSALKPKQDGKPKHALTGLEWLSAKNRLSRPQRQAGETYGGLYRASVMEGANPLKSCLDITPGGGDGIPKTPTMTLAWIADCKVRLGRARAALVYHVGMTAVCDLICGRGMMPSEIITDNRREADEVETTLRLALDLLAVHFRDEKRSAKMPLETAPEISDTSAAVGVAQQAPRPLPLSEEC